MNNKKVLSSKALEDPIVADWLLGLDLQPSESIDLNWFNQLFQKKVQE